MYKDEDIFLIMDIIDSTGQYLYRDITLTNM